MKLTTEFIELQDFVEDNTPPYPTKFKKLFIKPISKNLSAELIWNMKTNTITITLLVKHNNNKQYSRKIIYKNKIHTILEFTDPLHRLYSMTDQEISIQLPDDLFDQLLLSDYPYTKKEFDTMIHLSMSIILQREEYEKCNTLIDYRRDFYKINNWKYKKLDPNIFDISDK